MMDLAEALRIDDPRGQMNRNQEAAGMVWGAAHRWWAVTEGRLDEVIPLIVQRISMESYLNDPLIARLVDRCAALDEHGH